MNDKLYRDAMNRLPFSEDLEEKTIAMLKASSGKEAKEEATMKHMDDNTPATNLTPETTTNTAPDGAPVANEPVTSNTPEAPIVKDVHPAPQKADATQATPFWRKRKNLAIGGGVLAAAACLLLVIVPVVTGQWGYYAPERIVEADVNTVEALPVDTTATQGASTGGEATTATQADGKTENAGLAGTAATDTTTQAQTDGSTSQSAAKPLATSAAGGSAQNALTESGPADSTAKVDWSVDWSFGDVASDAETADSTIVSSARAPSGAAELSPPAEVAEEPEADILLGYAAAPYATGAKQQTAAEWNTPAWNAEEYAHIQENRFLSTLTSPLSTFAADVDTASYAKLRSAILNGQPVPADSVRIEEMLNYFSYSYAGPEGSEPFGVTTEMADCPWNPDSKLLLIGLQAKEIATEDIPAQNLVFLIDVSGSMDEPNKLPLVRRSFKLLLEQLQPTDTVSIVTYASNDRIVLDGVRASDKVAIMEAIDQLDAGGGTHGAAGIQTAYALAEKHFVGGGNNRIILATDGDLNIGVSDEGSLARLVEEKRETGVYLSVLGYGMGNYKDNKLEALADNGNGNYAYIDTIYEARKALVEETGGTFLTVAKDVKLQVEFNPAHVKGYRLIGYENRTMAAEDFADDTKDGGEVGSGHTVTVLYEIVPIDSKMEIDTVETKYQAATYTGSDEWLTLSIRCKEPDGDTSKLYTYPVTAPLSAAQPSDNMLFASAVAECGMLLRNSQYKGTSSYADVLDRLRATDSVRGDVYKEEFQYMVTLLAREHE